MFINYGASKPPAKREARPGRSQKTGDVGRRAGIVIDGSASYLRGGAPRTTVSSARSASAVANVAGKVEVKNKADVAATTSEVKSAKTPAERNALMNKLNAQRKAASAAAAVKQAALAGNAKALQDALAAQRRAEMEKAKAEAVARSAAEKAQREAEAKPLATVSTTVVAKPGESLTALAARANAAASQKLATYPTGVKYPSAKNGRVYEVRSRRLGPALDNYIFVTYPDGTTKNVYGTDPSFSVVFADLENAVAVANLRQQTVVETTGSTTGDVVTPQEAAGAGTGADASFAPSGADAAPATSTPAPTTSTDTTASSGGSGTMRVTEATSTSDYTPTSSDALPGSSDAAVVRASETALATEAQKVVDEAVAPADATTVSETEAVAASGAGAEESFFSKYKWPLVGVGVAAVLWAVNRK